jgi:DNA polymerase III gamma/tau subunit
MLPRKFGWACHIYRSGERIWGDDVATVELLLAHDADPILVDRGGHSPDSIAKHHYDPEVRALIRKSAISARSRADLVDPRTKEKARLAQQKAREAGRLAREQQKQAVKQREEAEARQKAEEAREREEAQRIKEQEEREAQEREAERAREQRLQNMRQGWRQMREAAERRGTQKVLDIKAKASASVACAHSSLAWMKRKGKGLCELCLKGCEKYSFQCPDCGAVACGSCKTKFCLI